MTLSDEQLEEVWLSLDTLWEATMEDLLDGKFEENLPVYQRRVLDRILGGIYRKLQKKFSG